MIDGMKQKVLLAGICLLSLLGCSQSNEDRAISFYKDYYESRYSKLSDVSVDSIRVLDTKDIKQEAQLLYDSITYYNSYNNIDSIEISDIDNSNLSIVDKVADVAKIMMKRRWAEKCNIAIKELESVINLDDSKLTEIFIQYKTMDDSLYNDIVYADEDFSSFYVIEDIDKFESDTLNTPLVKEIIKFRSVYFAFQNFKEENETLLHDLIKTSQLKLKYRPEIKGNVSLEDLFIQGKEAFASHNYDEAARIFQKVANQGNADAQNLLGICYKGGLGVAKDINKAEYWFRKAAEQGHANAQYCLGISYEKGIGVNRDHTKALNWLKKAADNGSTDAINYLKNNDGKVEK